MRKQACAQGQPAGSRASHHPEHPCSPPTRLDECQPIQRSRCIQVDVKEHGEAVPKLLQPGGVEAVGQRTRAEQLGTEGWCIADVWRSQACAALLCRRGWMLD